MQSVRIRLQLMNGRKMPKLVGVAARAQKIRADVKPVDGIEGQRRQDVALTLVQQWEILAQSSQDSGHEVGPVVAPSIAVESVGELGDALGHHRVASGELHHGVVEHGPVPVRVAVLGPDGIAQRREIPQQDDVAVQIQAAVLEERHQAHQVREVLTQRNVARIQRALPQILVPPGGRCALEQLHDVRRDCQHLQSSVQERLQHLLSFFAIHGA
ncbi:hypothetical protein Mapa_004066 [Marchantia paleacea]|nr:hypothetical protein Mapa_004066 [Marchantia paleacea]